MCIKSWWNALFTMVTQGPRLTEQSSFLMLPVCSRRTKELWTVLNKLWKALAQKWYISLLFPTDYPKVVTWLQQSKKDKIRSAMFPGTSIALVTTTHSLHVCASASVHVLPYGPHLEHLKSSCFEIYPTWSLPHPLLHHTTRFALPLFPWGSLHILIKAPILIARQDVWGQRIYLIAFVFSVCSMVPDTQMRRGNAVKWKITFRH